MWSLVVPVFDERLMGWVDPGFVDVRLMERLNLTDCGWSPHACDYVLNSVSSAELRELEDASSCWVELWSSISQYLLGFAVSAHGFLQELDGMLCRRVVMDP